MSEIKITLIQSSLHWESPEQNMAMFGEKIHSLGDAGDLIILPEMFSTGFSMNAVPLAEEMNGRTMEWMHKMAFQKKCTITGSIIVHEDGQYFNRLIWMTPNGSYNHYDKRHLFRLANEDKTYAGGNQQWVMILNDWKVFPLICYDLRFPVWSRRHSRFDYDLLIYVANWPERRSHAWKQLLIARAIENQSYVAGLNRTGKDGNDVEYSGDSAVIDFKGEQILRFRTHEEGIESVILSKKALIDFRKSFPFEDDSDKFELKL